MTKKIALQQKKREKNEKITKMTITNRVAIYGIVKRKRKKNTLYHNNLKRNVMK